MESQSSFQINTEEKNQKPRKKYEKPAVIYLAPLEATAAVCDPLFPELAKQVAGPCTNTFS
jgi:hypothetical protein